MDGRLLSRPPTCWGMTMSKQTLPSNLLHELAGSISGVHGFATVMARKVENEFLSMVLESANEAIATIRDMQLVESIETGQGAGAPRPCLLADVLPGDVEASTQSVTVDPDLLGPLIERVRVALTDEGEPPAALAVDGATLRVVPSGDLGIEDLDDGLQTGRRRFRPLALMKLVVEDWGGSVRNSDDPAFLIELPVS